MSDKPVDTGRRQFFRRFIAEQVVEPTAQAYRDLQEEAQIREWESVYDSELRAFGTDVLSATARQAGLATDGVGYTDVAKALVAENEDSDDERR